MTIITLFGRPSARPGAGAGRRGRIAAPFLALAVAACAHGLDDWDEIVTEAFFASAMRAGTAVKVSRGPSNGARGYVAKVRFAPSAGAEESFYFATVAVAPAGAFLDPREVERARAASPPDTRARDFPAIGLRARSEPVFFGPGGASFGVAFTTADGRYDVKVSLSSRLGDDLPDPGFDPFAAARRLDALYRERIR